MSMLRFAGLAACLFFVHSAGAQPMSPEEFAKHPEISEARSRRPASTCPALAVPTADGTETQLRIVRTDGAPGGGAVRFGKNQHITGIVWTDNERLVVSRAEKEFGKEQPVSKGELYAVNADSTDQEMLFGSIPDYNGTRGRRKDNGYAEIAKCARRRAGPCPRRLLQLRARGRARQRGLQGEHQDRRAQGSGAGQARRKHELRPVGSAPRDGPARRQRRAALFYRPTPGSEMQPMPKALVGYRTYGAWFEKDPQVGYVYISDDGEPAQLYKVDFTKGTRVKVAGKADQDVSSTQVSGNKGTPFAVIYDAGRPSVEYVAPDSEWAKLHAGLLKRFPGQLLQFNGFTRDEKTVLFHVYSDRNPGVYYQYSLLNKTISLVAEYEPWIKPENMAPMQPVEFTAKDGTKLFGFYTAKGTGPKPLVVMPHGGPIGPYDNWGYDSDAQFLASRGYAVLQVNYRGSGGRGFNFKQDGYAQWGALIQDDIADGVRWAIAQGKADPARVCIYGASFGGYSALMNPLRNPGMYKCAIGYAGVYDLNLMLKTDWSVKSKAGLRQLQPHRRR